MKTINLFALAVIAMGLTACGNQNTNPYVNAQYNNGLYGNQAGYGNYQGGCVPIQNGAFTFTAQGAQMNSAIILAGTLPANSTRPGTYGQVTMGGNMQVGMNQQGMIQYQPKMSSSGQIQIMVNPTGGTMSGTIQLSQTIVYQLMAMQAGGSQYYGQPGVTQPQQSQLCVQSLALDIVHTANYSYGSYSYGGMSMGFINQALVYLTLNNGQTIGPIPFY